MTTLALKALVDQFAQSIVPVLLDGVDGERILKMASKLPETDSWISFDRYAETAMQVREYVGPHDVVSSVVLGREDPQDEVWALAHSHEPGAVDNASGVAVCVEAARLLESLIARGVIRRPRRSIRFLTGHDCHGFFEHLISGKRLQPPLAGVCVDCVGLKPELCGRRMSWHATVPSSASFVNEVGWLLLAHTVREGPSGCTVEMLPFSSIGGAMIADPKYGFPCPRLGAQPCRSHHSLADTPKALDPAELGCAAAGVAAYLHFLADLATPGVMQLAKCSAEQAADRIEAAETPGEAFRFAATQETTLDHLQRWLWGGDKTEIMDCFRQCRQRTARAVAANATADDERGAGHGGDVIPFRRIPIAPTYEKMSPPLRERIQHSDVHTWALYWADGARSLDDIRRLASAEAGKTYSKRQIADFFAVMDEIGYVKLVPCAKTIGKAQLVRELEDFGLTAGMDVIVHSSLGAIGWVRGGADTVVEALLEVLGARGNLLMPSFNHRAAEVFNPLATPTTDGSIPDAMWRRPEAVRSQHPTHAVAAIGPKAGHWCADHVEVGIWAPESPIGRLVHGDGYILGIGVDHTASTAYHVAEVSMNAPCLDPFGSTGRMVDADGAVRTVKGLSWRDGACPVSPTELSKTLDSRGLQTRGRVGQADCVFVKAIDLWEIRREHLRDVCPTCPIRPLQYE
ncbi:MAG: AAC(3) family N-acetyltransferase [Lentisphaeria bacterium]|nr:AAC(3) family N-acetyltransferase [Lentisphaeria bacterium]